MKKIVWLMAGLLVLTTASSYILAQEPEGDERIGEEEIMEEGPGPGFRREMGQQGMEFGPGLKPGMGNEQRGQRERMFEIRNIRKERIGQQEGGFEVEEEVLLIIKKYDPKLLEKLEELKSIAPAKYKIVLRTASKMFMFAKMEKDVSLEKDIVRAFSLEYEVRELAGKYEKATDKEKESIKKELQTKVSELFDLKLKGQEIRIKKMDKELAKLRKQLDGRKASKSKIVKERVDELTGEGYTW
jgi:hypothetical protein